MDQTCLGCRKKGHMLSNCPDAKKFILSKNKGGICFNCGSLEHILSRCSRDKIGGEFVLRAILSVAFT